MKLRVSQPSWVPSDGITFCIYDRLKYSDGINGSWILQQECTSNKTENGLLRGRACILALKRNNHGARECADFTIWDCVDKQGIFDVTLRGGGLRLKGNQLCVC